jgi:hypothetical protein
VPTPLSLHVTPYIGKSAVPRREMAALTALFVGSCGECKVAHAVCRCECLLRYVYLYRLASVPTYSCSPQTYFEVYSIDGTHVSILRALARDDGAHGALPTNRCAERFKPSADMPCGVCKRSPADIRVVGCFASLVMQYRGVCAAGSGFVPPELLAKLEFRCQSM